MHLRPFPLLRKEGIGEVSGMDFLYSFRGSFVVIPAWFQPESSIWKKSLDPGFRRGDSITP